MNAKYTLTVMLLASAMTGWAAEKNLDTNRIEQLTGLKGTMNKEEGVFKVSAPRNDVKIAVDGWTMPPFMGLTSWAAFMPGVKGEAMVMGDLVLMQDEVNPVMSAALDDGLQVSALHNHFFFDEPKVYFMHIGGEGDTATLAKGVRAALDAVKSIRAQDSQPKQSFSSSGIPAKSSITAEPIQSILGAKGEAKDGMFKTVFGRKVK